MPKLLRHIIFILAFQPVVWAQTQDVWVYFKDKPNASVFLENPTEILSQRALDRRIRYNIAVDETDVPIDNNYYNQIVQIEGVEIIAKSKWLNGLHVRLTSDALDEILVLENIDHVEYLAQNKQAAPTQKNVNLSNKLDVVTYDNYGSNSNQIDILNGRILHDNGFSGQGMQIAVIDGGFINVNTMGAFQRLRDNNQILGTYNFVENTTEVYSRHYHGTMVLSTMAGYIENEYIGMAPDASYYLFISEDTSQEHPYEESLWIEAAEKADSLGVDVITTSLGYTEFDDPSFNHTYEDLDGHTTIISRGSKIATQKGMLLINSAGNWGDNPWHYIGAPADVENVLSIGAVNADGVIANFSSWGPTADGRLKPDVCAQGSGVSVINTSNDIVYSSGTSFSGPIMAGMATCLWQAYPNQTPEEIRQAIKESAHLYQNPDNHYGYGIPNFEMANGLLDISDITFEQTNIFPNPVDKHSILNIVIPGLSSTTELHLFDIQGKLVKYCEINNPTYYLETKAMSSGLYILQLTNATQNKTFKLLIK